jgi:hypothetical protein
VGCSLRWKRPSHRRRAAFSLFRGGSGEGSGAVVGSCSPSRTASRSCAAAAGNGSGGRRLGVVGARVAIAARVSATTRQRACPRPPARQLPPGTLPPRDEAVCSVGEELLVVTPPPLGPAAERPRARRAVAP